MSINGLYDSEIGDRLAKQSLLKKSVVKKKRRGNHSAKLCQCGNPLPESPKVRNNVRVCDACALVIKRGTGGNKAKNECVSCGEKLPRFLMFMRSGKLYCRECSKGIPENYNNRVVANECSACHTKMPRRKLTQRKHKLYCEACLTREKIDS